jgi:hypothetical protein
VRAGSAGSIEGPAGIGVGLNPRTRFVQTDGSRRIPIGGEFVNDGYLFAGMIYFTSIDGRLIPGRSGIGADRRSD